MRITHRLLELSSAMILLVGMAHCEPTHGAPVTVSSVMPSVVPNDVTTELTVTGTNFQWGVAEVDVGSVFPWNNVCAPIKVLSPTQFTCTLSANPLACGGQEVRAWGRFGSGDLDAAHSFRLSTKTLAFAFGTPQLIPALGLSRGLMAADFNGDQKLDLVRFGDGVTVLLGDGAGGLATSAVIPLGHPPASQAVGDFNGDQHLDIAIFDSQSNTVSVFFGSGTGTFSAAIGTVLATACGTQSACGAMTAADFNGDQITDLAIAQDFHVSVLLGQGTGGFAAATRFALGKQITNIATADFNGDNKPDVITVDYQTDALIADDLSMLMGDGMGGFRLAGNYSTDSGPLGLTIGDFNNDSRPDVMTWGPASLTVLLGNGMGAVNRHFSLPNYGGLGPAAVGDINHDGKLDLLWTQAIAQGSEGAKYLSLPRAALGNGVGGFAMPITLGQIADQPPMVVSDLNGDGRPELVLGSQDNIAVWSQCQ